MFSFLLALPLSTPAATDYCAKQQEKMLVGHWHSPSKGAQAEVSLTFDASGNYSEDIHWEDGLQTTHETGHYSVKCDQITLEPYQVIEDNKIIAHDDLLTVAIKSIDRNSLILQDEEGTIVYSRR